jgi:hypothetical protein
VSNSNGTRDKVIPPIRVDEEEDWRLRAAAEAERQPLSIWLRNLGLKRADELGIAGQQPAKRKAAR